MRIDCWRGTGRRTPNARNSNMRSPSGRRLPGNPLFAAGELDDNGELDVVPAGDAQPLFASREVATDDARALEPASLHVCVLPIWPAYGWQNLVGFHAAWSRGPGAAEGLRRGRRRRGPALGRVGRGGSRGSRRDVESTRQGARSRLSQRGRVETSTAKLAACFPQ